MTKPRVILADDQRLFVAGLEQLLASECLVVSTACDGPTLLTEIRRLRPEIVLLGLSIPLADGLCRVRAILQVDPRIRIIVLGVHEDPALAAEAFRQGASAYILKNCTVLELRQAVQAASEGRSYITPLVAGGMIQSLARPRPPADGDGHQHLTDRQREVLRLLAEGQSMKEVAVALNLTVRTVAFHKYRMMHSLNIKSSAALVRFAVAQHIV